ncbi:hypothetical protein Y032_0024g992 [Ancylostoma ceylanicum]|uniref:Uncharacterized protein n=1 Tax=Ancylostoma ceylanicum TaxID=53326 RepID=A0A016UWU6_9BILA|nr:hypothetical protein Y032_0024g992 [Ancylostoma ceylanicum]
MLLTTCAVHKSVNSLHGSNPVGAHAGADSGSRWNMLDQTTGSTKKQIDLNMCTLAKLYWLRSVLFLL